MRSSHIPIACLLLAAAAVAQQPGLRTDVAAAEPAEEIRSYTVEVIVFAYNEDISTGTETFEPEVIMPAIDELADAPASDDSAIDIETDRAAADVPADGADTELRYIHPFTYVKLEEQELTLTDAWSQLDRLDAYQPLMHFGWTQPTIPQDQTPALELVRFGGVPPGLEGSLQLYRSRFLHLVVDVSLAAKAVDLPFGTAANNGPVAVYGDDRLQTIGGNEEFMLQYAPLRYRINEDRILRNGETRYYDHPKFGVIAKLSLIEKQPVDDSILP